MTSSTNRSFNEIQGMLRKAGIGAGCAHGTAEEIGQAAVWLCRRGQDGVEHALSALTGVDDVPARGTPHGDKLVFEACKVANCGAAALDLLVAEHAIAALSLTQVDAPMLLVGMAGIRVADNNIAFVFSQNGKEIVTVDQSSDGFGDLGIQSGADLIITVREAAEFESTVVQAEGGNEIRDLNWRECEKLAWRTYVPATAESRAKGAGSNLTDND